MKNIIGVIKNADEERLAKAMTGFLHRRYKVKMFEQEDQEVRAYISNGDGRKYAVTVNEARAFCDCPDYFISGHVCKHIIMLALHLLTKGESSKKKKKSKPHNDSIFEEKKTEARVLYRSEGAKPHYCSRCGSHYILTLDMDGRPLHLCPNCDSKKSYS